MIILNTPITLDDESDTKKIASLFAKLSLAGSVWLSGDLGAGKTTFVRYFLQSLGYIGAVKSPTFTLVESYELSDHIFNNHLTHIYHADLYRLNDPEELDFIGFFDYFSLNSLVLIEWASRAEHILPKPNFLIDIQRLDDNKRQITIYDNDKQIDQKINNKLIN